MGVVHLMDMMTDMDALRNEVLLLLIGLTHANAAIQQIAAFEGAFERLLNIIKYAAYLLHFETSCTTVQTAFNSMYSLAVQPCLCAG